MNRVPVLAAVVLASTLAAPGARAAEIGPVEAELHGYYELQLRAMVRDFDFSDDIDLTQWYNVLNLEAEFDFAPGGWGPFDVLQGFLRVQMQS